MNRPASVTILAIIGIIFGALGIIACAFQLFGTVMYIAGDQETVEAVQGSGLVLSETDSILIGLSEFVGILLSAVLLAGSIGIFLLKKWGRYTMISYALLTIPNNLCLAVVYMKASLPTALEQQAAAQPGVSQEGVLAIAIACLSCFWIVLNLYPILVLVFMNIKSVKYAFETGGAPPHDPWAMAGYGPPQDYSRPAPYPQGYYPEQQQQPPPQQQQPYYPYYPPAEQQDQYPPQPPPYPPEDPQDKR